MKTIILPCLVALNWSCGGQNKTNTKMDKSIKMEMILQGKIYEGIAGQGGEPHTRCEGCGNPGHVSFIDDATLELNMPGDDQIFRLGYIQKGLTVTTDNGDVLSLSEDYKILTAGYGSFVLKEIAPELFSQNIDNHDSKAKNAIEQKNDAISLFLSSEAVREEIRNAEELGFSLLSVTGVPYMFAYSDEGPISSWIITGWLGKSYDEQAAHGWEPRFIVAKVHTDHWGNRGVHLIDEKSYVQAMQDL